jgi:hypothetical protein
MAQFLVKNFSQQLEISELEIGQSWDSTAPEGLRPLLAKIFADSADRPIEPDSTAQQFLDSWQRGNRLTVLVLSSSERDALGWLMGIAQSSGEASMTVKDLVGYFPKD